MNTKDCVKIAWFTVLIASWVYGLALVTAGSVCGMEYLRVEGFALMLFTVAGVIVMSFVREEG